MPIDNKRLTDVTLNLMDEIEKQPYGDEAEIKDVMVLVTVHYLDPNRENKERVTVHYGASPLMAPHVGLGLLQYVQNLIQNAIPRR